MFIYVKIHTYAIIFKKYILKILTQILLHIVFPIAMIKHNCHCKLTKE